MREDVKNTSTIEEFPRGDVNPRFIEDPGAFPNKTHRFSLNKSSVWHFEGQPADNAKHFVEWLENVKDNAFAGIKYAVFGCGNKDWVNTYQRIPTLIDHVLGEHGAVRLVERGEGDAAAAEFFETFDKWEKAVWEKLGVVSTTISRYTSEQRSTA